MRLRNIAGSQEAVAASVMCINQPQEYKGRWLSLFPDCKSLALEIGCGKGRFAREMAAAHPDTAFVAMEMYSSVLYKAIRRLGEEECANLRFVCADAMLLTSFFAEDEVSRIYLNFSDPWPKERHARRRLTSADFLRRYDKVLKKDGVIEFKTDNVALFDWSLTQTPGTPFHVMLETHDLHADEELMQGNVMTEYEEKFSARGNPICKMVLKREQMQ